MKQDPVPLKELDVAVRLYLPADHLLYEIDNPTGSVGAERVFVVAPEKGELQVEIDGEGAEGVYSITGVKIHQASEKDRVDARAEELFYRARAEARGKNQNLSGARDLYEQAERLWRSIGNRRGEAHALERRITLLAGTGETGEPLLALQTRDVRLFREAGDKSFELKMRIACAVSQKNLGRLQEAEEGLREVLVESRKTGITEHEADAGRRLGSLYKQKGQKVQALSFFEKSLAYWRATNRLAEQIEVLSEMGSIYESLGDYNMVRKCYEEASVLKPAREQPKYKGQILTRFAELYEKMKQPETALKYALQAPAQRQLAHDIHGQAVSLGEIGLIYRELGDFARARAFLENALVILQSLKNRQDEAIAHYNLGLDLVDERNSQRAIDQFQRCLELSRSTNFLEGELDCLYGLGQAEDRRGNPLRARAYVESAVRVGEKLPRRMGNEGNDPSSDAAREGAHELLVRLLVASPPSYTGPAELAHSFEISEKSRGRTLLESLSTDQVGSGWLKGADPKLLAEFDGVKRALAETDKVVAGLRRRGRPVDALLTRQAELNEQLTLLEARLRDGTPWADAVRPSPITLATAQGMLDTDSVLLEYLLGAKRSFLWMVTDKSASIAELPPRDVIELKVREFYGLVKERSVRKKAQTARVATDLRDILLGPAKGLLKRHLLIVRGGALQYVSFSALPDYSAQQGTWQQPLIVGHDITYLPSISVLHAIREVASKRPKASRSIAIFSNPVFDPDDYQPLPFSAEEAHRVRSLFTSEEKPLEVEGYEASRALAKSGVLRDFRYLLFATHGLNYPEQPNLSGIALSQRDAKGHPIEGELRLQDVKSLDLRADLVVLSACNTSAGSEIHGEGFVGLTQGFFYAGASRITVSLWNVNDQAAPDLIERLFKGIVEEKLPPTEALRQAQLWMYKQGRPPYFWAGFELHGEYR
ncbi:MAG: CHAT domain-containing tetratricopeptide repeat protein [Thermoanaerobaculia bacterium]